MTDTIKTTAVMSLFEQAKEELVRISTENNGISPAIVLSAAVNEENPLHGYFIWDDTEAAEKYRLNQAALLIRRVKFDIIRPNLSTREIEIKTTRAFVSPKKLRGKNGQSYVPLESALSDESLKVDLLETVKSELLAIRQKYESLVELTRVWQAIDSL